MPTNLNDYLLNYRASFQGDALNEVDSLVFCTISYLHFENGVFKDAPDGKIIPLPIAMCGILQSDLFGTSWLNDFHGEGFMYALMQSNRFMETRVGFYVDDTSDTDDMQFSAIVFFLPEKRIYIAFRGTDDSISGWKEDFDLCYKKQTPSQIRGREFVEDIARRFPDHRLYVGGHSKGGNTAEYAALTCDDDVFNHDAPGFFEAPSKRFSTESYNRKLHKTVPQSSVFTRSSTPTISSSTSTHPSIGTCTLKIGSSFVTMRLQATRSRSRAR